VATQLVASRVVLSSMELVTVLTGGRLLTFWIYCFLIYFYFEDRQYVPQKCWWPSPGYGHGVTTQDSSVVVRKPAECTASSLLFSAPFSMSLKTALSLGLVTYLNAVQ
jgi:hypothetical protein